MLDNYKICYIMMAYLKNVKELLNIVNINFAFL